MHLRPALLAVVVVASMAPGAPAIEELPGPVVIAGSGDLSKDTLEAFFALAGKDKAKIVLLVVSDAKEEELLKPWKDLNPGSLTVVKAGDDTTAKQLDEATGVWVVGTKLVIVEKELQKVQSRGVAVGGGSGLLDLGLLPGFKRSADAGSVGRAWK